jgi:hypothetical protein
MKWDRKCGWRAWSLALLAVLLGVGVGGGCRTKENMRELARPATLSYRWADGRPVPSLILVSVNTMPYKSITRKWNQWERSQAIDMPLGTHNLVVRLPQEFINFGYKEVRRKSQWSLQIQMAKPGDYTAYIDPDSDLVTAVFDDDGTRVDIPPPPPPAVDPASQPSEAKKPQAPIAN